MLTVTSSEEILHTLVHDLRQPLGNLETSLFYLDLLLNPSDRVREQMLVMERQVAQAAQLLQLASDELRALRDQREGEGDGDAAPESLPLTKSATAGGT